MSSSPAHYERPRRQSSADDDWLSGSSSEHNEHAASAATASDELDILPGESGVSSARKRFNGFLSGTALKWIAIASMLVDHIGAIILHPLLLSLLVGATTSQLAALDAAQIAALNTAYIWMRRVGRMAFPLFCMALVEGFTHTHNRNAYAVRLGLFALVSEIPFDLAFGTPFSLLATNNVMFTLLLAFLALWAADWASTRLLAESGGLSLLARVVIFALCLAAAAYLAMNLGTDYSWFGVVLVGALYAARRSHVAQFVVGAAMVIVYCLISHGWLELYALAGLAVILLYNGKRGRGMKYFFYVFYPAHLLLLTLVRFALIGLPA